MTLTHAVDVTGELLSLVFIYSMADICIRSLDGDFAFARWENGRGLLLELDVELCVFK
jgi:asparagine synthetase B (glutamine-hydrolysing)